MVCNLIKTPCFRSWVLNPVDLDCKTAFTISMPQRWPHKLINKLKIAWIFLNSWNLLCQQQGNKDKQSQQEERHSQDDFKWPQQAETFMNPAIFWRNQVPFTSSKQAVFFSQAVIMPLMPWTDGSTVEILQKIQIKFIMQTLWSSLNVAIVWFMCWGKMFCFQLLEDP